MKKPATEDRPPAGRVMVTVLFEMVDVLLAFLNSIIWVRPAFGSDAALRVKILFEMVMLLLPPKPKLTSSTLIIGRGAFGKVALMNVLPLTVSLSSPPPRMSATLVG